MTFGNRLITSAATMSMLAVLVAGGLARAQNGKVRGAAQDRGQTKDANSGKHHEGNKGEGPVVDNWKIVGRSIPSPGEVITREFGSASLTLNSDGSWNFSGQMNQNQVDSACRFYVVMAVKDSGGPRVEFSDSGIVEEHNPQSYSWQRQGNNRAIKDNFNSLKKSHDWIGHWTCVDLPRAGNGGPSDPNWVRLRRLTSAF